MKENNFKKAVLDALGVKFNPDANKIKELNTNYNLSKKKNSFNIDKGESDDAIMQKLSAGINNLLSVDSSDEDFKNKQKVRKRYEDDLKTFTLDDLLKNSKGFEIGKGIHIANDSGFKDRNAKEDEAKNIKISFLKRKIFNGVIGYMFNKTVENEDSADTIKKGDFIFIVDKSINFPKQGKNTNNKNGGPASIMEEAIRQFIGGRGNLTPTDATSDINSGIFTSVKCYNKGTENFNVGSLNSLNNWNHDKPIKFEAYNWELISDINSSKYYKNILNALKADIENKNIYVVLRNNEHSGTFYKNKKGELKLVKTGSSEFVDSKNINNEIKNIGKVGVTWKDIEKLLPEFINSNKIDDKNSLLDQIKNLRAKDATNSGLRTKIESIATDNKNAATDIYKFANYVAKYFHWIDEKKSVKCFKY